MRHIGGLALLAFLGGCGGGGGGPEPAPAASVTSGPLVLMGAQGPALAATLSLSLNFRPVGSFGVRASVQDVPPFDSKVEVVPAGANSYTLRLPVYSGTAPGYYSGTARLQLCADADCVTRQPVPEVELPYTLAVLPPGTSWPGDHLTPLSAWSSAPEWATFQGNAAHSGFVPVDIDPALITPRWRIMGTGHAISAAGLYPQTLTVAAGTFYQSGPSAVYARNEFDGSLKWVHDFRQDKLDYPSANPPAIYGDTVYVEAGQQSSSWFYALDAATGERRFRSPMASQWDHYLAPTMGPLGIYQDGGTYGGLYGFDRSSGATLFFHEILGNVSMWTPAVDEAGVYYYGRGQLLALDPQSGALRARIEDASGIGSGYEIAGAPVIGAPGRVFAATYADSLVDGGTRGNTLTAFDVPGSRIAWQLSGNFPSAPAYHAGHLYVANESPYRVESRAESDGSLEWAWTPPPGAGTRFRSAVLLTNRLFFVATDTATYAVDLETHQAVWSFPVSGQLALSRNGVLYIQNTLLTCAFTVK